jgi:excisionase family DNA binding protein
MTTRETADLLCVSVFTVRRLALDGTLPTIRFTERSRLRFRRADVDALLRRWVRRGEERRS